MQGPPTPSRGADLQHIELADQLSATWLTAITISEKTPTAIKSPARREPGQVNGRNDSIGHSTG
jgi:hypothetical protein